MLYTYHFHVELYFTVNAEIDCTYDWKPLNYRLSGVVFNGLDGMHISFNYHEQTDSSWQVSIVL